MAKEGRPSVSADLIAEVETLVDKVRALWGLALMDDDELQEVIKVARRYTEFNGEKG